MERVKGKILKKSKLSVKAQKILLVVGIILIATLIAGLGAYANLWLEYKKINFMYWLFN